MTRYSFTLQRRSENFTSAWPVVTATNISDAVKLANRELQSDPSTKGFWIIDDHVSPLTAVYMAQNEEEQQKYGDYDPCILTYSESFVPA